MREGIQTLLAELGEAACLALCICELGKPGMAEGEALEFIIEGIDRGYIYYDEEHRENPDNCFLCDRDSFMDLVTGETGWKSTTEDGDYLPRIGEKVIEYWEWTERLKDRIITHIHFKLKTWDPYYNSRTTKFGQKRGFRVFRKAKKQAAIGNTILFPGLRTA